MIDWQVFAGDVFLGVSAAGLLAAPVYGASLHARRLRLIEVIAMAAVLVVMGIMMAASWRGLTGGVRAAVTGSLALAVSIATFIQIGRVIRRVIADDLLAAMAGLLFAAAFTIVPFAAGPLLGALSLTESAWLLAANPLVTVSAAAGIDLLHLDLIYRLSPLAHRGVALSAWTTTSVGYAVMGLAAYGASRVQTWRR